MTDLNKVNFMSKERFDNLAVTNDDEIYIVETDMAIDEEVVHKAGNETIGGNKSFSDSISVTGTTTLNNALAVNAGITIDKHSLNIINDNSNYCPLLITNGENNQAQFGFNKIEFMPLSTQTNGGYIDFHYAGSSDDFTARFIEDASGQISYYGNESFSVSNSTTEHTLATKGWVNNPSLSTNIVHRTGDETIGGIKTFTSHTYMQSGNDMSYTVKCINADNTAETQGVLTQGNFRVIDNNALIIGDVRIVRSTAGTVTSSLLARNYASDNNGVNAIISCSVDNEGEIYTSAPTPPVADNSTQIATTAYVNSKIQFVNALPANPVNGVLYLIPES